MFFAYLYEIINLRSTENHYYSNDNFPQLEIPTSSKRICKIIQQNELEYGFPLEKDLSTDFGVTFILLLMEKTLHI